MIRVALAQINTTVGDLRGNAGKILEWNGRAREGGADLVVFPELTISGYSPEDLLLRSRFVSDCEAAVRRIATSAGPGAMLVGFPHLVGDNLYNAAALLDGGEVKLIYHKMALPNYGVFDEKRYFQPGDRGAVIEVGGVSLGIHICEDSWDAERKATQCSAARSVDGVVNLSASPYSVVKMEGRLETLGDVAEQCDAPVLYTNLIGGQDAIVFDGGSMVVSPAGKIVRIANRFEEDLLFHDLEPRARSERNKASTPKPGRCTWDTARVASGDGAKPEPPERKAVPPELPEEEEIYSCLVLGTRDYLWKNGFRRAVLGLSGGIDSALVAAVAADALGKENLVAVSMPGPYTSGGTRSDARTLAENLGIEFHEIPIGPIDGGVREALADLFAGTEEGVAEENIQARSRGMILMALSNKFGWIVLNTGNKSESAVGYCTLYGDMVGGLAVIGDVPKTVVYKLSRWRNSVAGSTVIPESIIERPPSAELRADQKDSDSLPEYAFLDRILEEYIENERSPEEIARMLGEEETVRRVVRMVNAAEYKRRQAPPNIKITPRAFGKDRRIPITNRYSSKSRY